MSQIETDNKTQLLNNLHGFMDKFRVNKQVDIKPTHLSMGSYLGSFNIPDNNMAHFYKYYKKAIKSGCIPSILESHLDQGPIIIDVDMKYTLKTEENPRAYTNNDIMNILRLYNQIIITYLAVNEDDFNIYILEKSKPKIINKDEINNKVTYKDGIHIIYPFICANNKLQLFFREIMVNKLVENKILDHLNLENSIDDVFDKAVIERNNWLLYGSCKDGNRDFLYSLTKIYDFDLNQQELDEVDLINLPTLLSIRKFKSEEHSEYVDGITMEKVNTLYTELIGKKGNNRPYAQNSDIRKAFILVNLLSDKRAKNYSSWIEVGFCLHNIDESLLELWIDFSRKSPSQFKEGECEKLWNKFKYEGLSIGSLYRWAKEDNPSEYSDFLLTECDELIRNSLNCKSCLNYPIARVFYEFNKYQYVCTSISKKKWYEYDGHRWKPMDEANSIVHKLNTELSNNYLKLGIAYGQKAINADGYEKEQYMMKSKLANNIAQKLQNMNFKKEIISELLHLYYDSKFMEKLDENRYLIGFDNGVYDLKNHYFRNGRPEDHISMTTHCDYIPYNINNEHIIRVTQFFESIQPDPVMYNYLITKLSSFLEGVQRDQRFEIWTGEGANGKGRIIKLILDSFGDYGCTIPISLLTKGRGDANTASPALSQTKGKRCCVFQEPEPDDKIYVGHMKNLVGGDKMMARSLYSDPIEFYPQFKTILACNKLPDVNSADFGTWRRIRVVPFEITFVSNPKGPNEKQIINNLDDLIAGWRSAFMSILIEKYKEYIEHGINEPGKVLCKTNEYQKSSDLYMEYIRDNLLCTNNKEFISMQDIWANFKSWHKETGRAEKDRPKRAEFKSALESRIGKTYCETFVGYRFKDLNTITERFSTSNDVSNTSQNEKQSAIKYKSAFRSSQNIDYLNNIDKTIDDIFINSSI